MKYLVPALNDLGQLLKGQKLAPLELYAAARRSLHFVGYQGLAMIAVSGLDMAAWDALAQAAGVPLCVLLGGSVGPVNAYNSNGLWLKEPAAVAAEAPQFLELPPLLVGPPAECTLELEEPSGRKLRILLKGPATTQAAALGRMLYALER